jgi:hypothetical protein
MMAVHAVAPPACTAVVKPGLSPMYSQNTEASIRCGWVNEKPASTPSMSWGVTPASAIAARAAAACMLMQLCCGSRPTGVSAAPVITASRSVRPMVSRTIAR